MVTTRHEPKCRLNCSRSGKILSTVQGSLDGKKPLERMGALVDTAVKWYVSGRTI